MKICIVIANYYPKIAKNLLIGASKVLESKGIKNSKKIIAPGIFELPTVISKNISKYDAFVALGCVIKGKTPHFDFISRASINGIMHLSIKCDNTTGISKVPGTTTTWKLDIFFFLSLDTAPLISILLILG